MKKVFEKAIVEKRNVLNELRSNNMTLQELRFFSIYLSKINPWDKSTRVVRFPLDDFRRIMELGTDINITHFKGTVRRILQQVVEVPNENGLGYTAFQLFKRAKIKKNENDEWYVEFDAHDDALPLMFDFKNRYFKYELWNALRLKSSNQVRMYEILKQYEKLGKRELPVTELRELLGINKYEYSGRTGWSDFKKKVLDSCQEALKECTDLCFSYERGKTGKGGKWLTIVFFIQRNKDYSDQLTLDEFIAGQPEPDPLVLEPMYKYSSDNLAFLAEACNNEFDNAQMETIFAIIANMELPENKNGIWAARYHHLEKTYKTMNVYAEEEKKSRKEPPIRNRYKYLVGMLEKDAQK